MNLPNPHREARRVDALLRERAATGRVVVADMRGEGPRSWRGLLAPGLVPPQRPRVCGDGRRRRARAARARDFPSAPRDGRHPGPRALPGPDRRRGHDLRHPARRRQLDAYPAGRVRGRDGRASRRAPRPPRAVGRGPRRDRGDVRLRRGPPGAGVGRRDRWVLACLEPLAVVADRVRAAVRTGLAAPCGAGAAGHQHALGDPRRPGGGAGHGRRPHPRRGPGGPARVVRRHRPQAGDLGVRDRSTAPRWGRWRRWTRPAGSGSRRRRARPR